MAAFIIGTVFISKIVFALIHPGLWGVDGGAYILSANAVLGNEFTNADFPRPPLAPGWLLVPFISALGPDNGLKVFSASAGVILQLAFIPFARAFLTPTLTIFGLFFLSFDFMMAEMWAAGPLPQIGFAFLLLAFLAITRICQGRTSYQWLLMVAIPAIALTNQTAAGIALVTLPIYLLVSIMIYPGKTTLSGSLALPLVLGVIFSLPLLPYYTDVIPGSSYTAYQDTLIRGVVGLDHAVWIFNALALGFGIAAYRMGPPHIKPLVIVMWLLAFLSPWLSNDEALQNIFYRSRYLIMVPLYICGIIAVKRIFSLPLPIKRWKTLPLFWVNRRFLQAAVAYLAIAMVVGFGYQAVVESRALTMVSADGTGAIGFLAQENTEQALVFTNSYPVSLYTAAFTGAPTAWTSAWIPPKRYEQAHYDGLCVMNWLQDCEPREAAGRLKIGYILADEKWPNSMTRIWQQPNENPWPLTAEAPWLEQVYEHGTVRVWRVKF